MDSPTSLRQAIQQMAPPAQMGVIEGEVISEAPLRIQAAKDARLTLGEAALVVPQHLTDYEVEFQATAYISAPDENGHCSLTGGKMIIQNHLQKGDRVLLLAFDGKQRYLVMDRVGGSKDA